VKHLTCVSSKVRSHSRWLRVAGILNLVALLSAILFMLFDIVKRTSFLLFNDANILISEFEPHVFIWIAVVFLWIGEGNVKLILTSVALLLAAVAVAILLYDIWGALDVIQFNDDFVREMKYFVEKEIEQETKTEPSRANSRKRRA
jgi:nitrogen fixation-related uncharacterized protein